MALADRAGVVHADLHSGRDPRLINDHNRCMRGLPRPSPASRSSHNPSGPATGVRHGGQAGSLGVRLCGLRTNGQSARHTSATQTSRPPFGSILIGSS
jgi:hypothetical protein